MRYLSRWYDLWNQSVGRIQPKQLPLQGGGELSSWSSGHLFETTAARFQFDNDHEIIVLKSNITQATNDIGQPSIAGPLEGGSTIDLLAMMEQGCYLRVAQGSGFPIVLVRDSSDPDWHGNTLAAPGYFNRQLIVDTAGVWCPPCKRPALLPPTARYIGGFQNAACIHPIGGAFTDDAGQTYTDANGAWYVYLEASLFPFTSAAHTTIYSGFFKSANTTTDADAVIHFPTMPMRWSDPRGGVNDYRGCIAINGPSAMVNTDMQFHSYDHDCATIMSGVGTGELDVSYGMQNLPQYVISAYWFQFMFLLDDIDAENGTIPANTHFQAEL
jgi:hypothetical protein